MENHLARESMESDVPVGNSIVPRFVLSYLKCNEQDGPSFVLTKLNIVSVQKIWSNM